MLGAPPDIGRRLRPPATQPVCGAPPSFVGRKDLPLQRVALTFTERDAMRAGRPDAARQSRVVSGPQFSPLTKEIQTEAQTCAASLVRVKTCGVSGFAATAADGAGYESSALLLQSHLTEWLGNSRAGSPTVGCAADDVAAWSAAECWMFELALSQ